MLKSTLDEYYIINEILATVVDGLSEDRQDPEDIFFYRDLNNKKNYFQGRTVNHRLYQYLYDHGFINPDEVVVYRNIRMLRYKFIFIDIPYDEHFFRKVSTSLRNHVFAKSGGKCVKCESTDRLEVDHIVPFSKGGLTRITNLQILCKTCNLSKWNRYAG